MKVKILSIFFILILRVFAFEFGPMGFDKRIDTGEGYGEFAYTNSSNEVIRYKVKIFSTGRENDISKYVSVYPKILTIKPQSIGRIKVYVEAPPTLKKGLYRFMVGSESVSVPYLQKSEKGKIAPSVSLKTSVALEMEAYVGEVKEEFNITNEKIKEIIDKEGKKKKMYTSKLLNDTERGYEIGVGFFDGNNSLISVNPMGRIKNGGELLIEEEIPPLAKKVVFYDYNNQVFVGQKIDLKSVK